MYFTGPYLRVTSPRTTNGINPKISGGQVETKEDFLPLTARKKIEAKNRRLIKNGFPHLVMEIEEVGNGPVKARKTKSK